MNEIVFGIQSVLFEAKLQRRSSRFLLLLLFEFEFHTRLCNCLSGALETHPPSDVNVITSSLRDHIFIKTLEISYNNWNKLRAIERHWIIVGSETSERTNATTISLTNKTKTSPTSNLHYFNDSLEFFVWALVRFKLSLNSISEQCDWVSPNVPNTLWFYSVDFVPSPSSHSRFYTL